MDDARSSISLTRRAGLGLLWGAAAVLIEASATKDPTYAIDVHHHFFPPALRGASNQALANLTGGAVPAQIRDWTPAHSLEAMDRNGIARAVVSASWRPALLDMDPGQRGSVARSANEFGARMAQDNPKRFSQFAFLPMPDIDASLAELTYCLDILKFPGVGLMTSYGQAWLGDPAFAPLLEELNRRRTLVFCHPQPAACCGRLMPRFGPEEAGLLEFPYDTGRAVIGLLLSGSLVAYPNIRWIFAHSGGPLPALAGRIRTHIAQLPPERIAVIAPHGVDYELRRLFYETADAAYGPAIAALMGYVPSGQVLFGTDFPYVSIEANVRELAARRLPPRVLAAVRRQNALRLAPQLA